MSQQPEKGLRSEDGLWEWDGQAWRPIGPAGSPQDIPSPPPASYGGSYGPVAASGTGGGGLAIAALILSIFSMVTWLLPIIGLPISITGLVLGIIGRKGSNRGLAITGIILSSVSLVLVLLNAALGAYMGATGQLHIFRP
jgi:hypothetical protein